MSQAQDHSAIWSSLITLESVRPHTSVEQVPSETYRPLSATLTAPNELLNKRHQKLAAAIAFIGATSPDSKTVTACCSEISFPTDNEQQAVVLRIAQNQPIAATELDRFRDLLKVLTEIVLSRKVDWNVKEERHSHVQFISDKFLLPLVVARCRAKISSILREPYSKPFRAWYAANYSSATFLDFIPSDSQDDLKEFFSLVYSASSIGHKNDEIIAVAIRCASLIISLGVTSTFSFEEQWTKYDNPEPPSMIEEDPDDYETLNEVDCQKSKTHRFLHKLARYRSTCHVVVRELVALLRYGNNLNIAIETVPISDTTSTPSNENEYSDLNSFLLRCIGVDAKTLDPKKLDTLRDKWGTAWEKGHLILHAEMQLTLFYATHPRIFPVQGYIGVSKKCCWCCNFVLKHLQIVPDPLSLNTERDKYTEQATGLPLIFSVHGTHGTKYPLWVFPNPSKHILSHTLDDDTFLKVCRRFELVREDLQKVLLEEVQGLIPELHKPEYDSDSSELSELVEALGQARLDIAELNIVSP